MAAGIENMTRTDILDPAGCRQGIGQLRSILAQAIELAGQVERGQASTPLRDHFETSAASMATVPFTRILLGMDATSRAAALDWLCGEDFHVLRAKGTNGQKVSGQVQGLRIPLSRMKYHRSIGTTLPRSD
jgi:hypothetical protein